jgi:hypothetical protein
MKNLRIVYLLLYFSAAACLPESSAQAEMEVIADAEGQQGLTIIRMTVTPAAEPVPALKHRFRVPMHERKPGNAATHYLRSFGEGGSPGRQWRMLRDRYGEEVDDWYDFDFPIDKIPMEKFREAARAWDNYVNEHIRSASVRRECEWGLEEMDLRGMEAIEFLLPDAQESRAISRALALLSRRAILDQNYDGAIDYIRMNYQLGQDISKQRFLVCSLVGMAEVGMANKSVIELISASGSPNLYWALTELPRPIIDMREAMNLEMSLGLRMFPILLDVETKQHAPEEWTRLVTTVLKDLAASQNILGGNRFPEKQTLAQLGAMGFSLVIYPTAKQRLIDSGKSIAEVEAMSVSQVLFIDTAREFQKVADEFEKWSLVPFHQMRDVEIDSFELSDGFGKMLADMLLPAVQAARSAQIRTQWQINALRILEALRMHAAIAGKLPASLDEITVVPVPDNPITRQSFVYRFEGQTAILELPFSDGMPGVAWRFEIQLAESK